MSDPLNVTGIAQTHAELRTYNNCENNVTLSKALENIRRRSEGNARATVSRRDGRAPPPAHPPHAMIPGTITH